MASNVTKAALALKRRNAAIEQVKTVWEAHRSIKYDEARRIPHTEVASALNDEEWEAEYLIPGKNTHVRFSLKILNVSKYNYIKTDHIF